MSDVSKIRVLSVDDNAHDRALIRDALEREGRGFAMIEATDRESFERALARGGFDMVLTDFNILGFEGLEVIRAVRKRRPDVPVIVVTGTGSEEIAVQALKDGADDYVIKTPRHISHLPHTILKVLEAWKTRHELEVWQANLKAIVENVSDGILVVDKDGTILFANPACEDLFETSPEKLQGQSFRYPLSTGELVEIELPARKGETGAAEMRAARIQWGGSPCFVITLRDITARKQAEEALRKSQQHLAHLFSINPAIVYTLNPERFIATWVSPNISGILGYTPEEVLKPGWWSEHLHQHDRKRALKAMDNLLDKGHLIHEYRFHKKDGGFIWVRDELSVVKNKAGDPIEIAGTWIDVTEQRQMEEQFHQSQKLESIGRLAGGVAHDFNNMLNIILLQAEEALLQLHSADPLHTPLKEIVTAARSSSNLTRQLLAFSRKQVIQAQVVDLNRIIRDLHEMLSRLIGEDIQLNLRLRENLGRVKVDPGQLEQIIMNMGINARHAMPNGGTITIETQDVELDRADVKDHAGVQPGRYVRLSMADTGCGMDEVTRKKIFEPFFTTKEQGKGTGLGLSTVYGIVKQSGGYINVSSQPGHGTTFAIYFPITEEPEEVASYEKRGTTESSGKGELILVVEDEDAIRRSVEYLLPKFNYRVAAAANPGEALLLVEEQGLRPDMVLTDVVMPSMNGETLVNRLKKTLPDLKVLFMSGYDSNIVSREGVLEPGVHFLQKPFQLPDLRRKLKEVLGEGG